MYLISFRHVERVRDHLSVLQGGELGGTIDGVAFPELPWLELLNERLATGGFSRLVTSLTALILGRKIEALRMVTPKLKSFSNVPAWLEDWLQENDPETCWLDYINRPDFQERLGHESALEEAFVLTFVEKDEGTNKRFLRLIVQNNYFGSLTDSEATHVGELGVRPVFLGRKLSCRFGTTAILDDRFPMMDIEILGGDIKAAESLLNEVAQDTTDPFMLCKVATAWVTQLNNRDAGTLVLQKAESLIDERRLIACPWSRWQVFGEKETARRMMDSYIGSSDWPMERELLQADGIMDFAELYADIGHSRCQLSAILQGAGEYIETVNESIRCAELGIRLLKDEGLYSKMMERAESFVAEIDDWDDVILQYSIEERIVDVRRCLALAENQAKSFHDWDYLAGMVRRTSDDEHLFRKCMEQVEGLAKSPNDWKACAETWETYLSKEEADRCLKYASELEET